MLLPHFPCKELPQLVTPFLVVILNPALQSHYYNIVYIFNSSFLVRVLAMPHPLCTYTLRVLYECAREFVPSVYFLPITWNGISPPTCGPAIIYSTCSVRHPTHPLEPTSLEDSVWHQMFSVWKFPTNSGTYPKWLPSGT